MRELFGGWKQTAIVLAVAFNNGEMALNEALRVNQWLPKELRLPLTVLTNRQVIEVTRDRVRLAPKLPGRANLIAFVQALVKAMPSLDTRPRVNELPVILEPTRGRLRKTRFNVVMPTTTKSPTGTQPDAFGTPLLFGSVARFKAFTALAATGPMNPKALSQASQTSDGLQRNLLTEGWLSKKRHSKGNRSKVAIGLSPSIAGYDAFVALLRKLNERWPTDPKAIALQDVALPKTKIPKIETFFGKGVRSEVMLTLAAMKIADATMLQNAIPSFDAQEIHRALWMYVTYGIVRQARFDGNRPGFELDPAWFAAAELRRLLDVLLALDKRYQGRAGGSVHVMRPNRRKSRENAVKAAARKGSQKRPKN